VSVFSDDDDIDRLVEALAWLRRRPTHWRPCRTPSSCSPAGGARHRGLPHPSQGRDPRQV